MGKFKIGDRVVATKTFSDITAGNGYKVVEVDHHDDDMPVRVIDDAGDRYWLYSDQFRLIPTFTISPGNHYRTRSGKPTSRVTVGDTGFEAVVDGRVRIFDAAGGAVHGDDDIVEAWVPKVGERVVEAEPKQYDFVGHWRDYWENSQGPLVDNTFVVTSVGAEWISYSNREDGGGPNCTVKLLQPAPIAPQPAAQEQAALKIEAGRYYKTRDGRKVGPMKTSRMPKWPFEGGAVGEGDAWYNADGTCPHIPDDDLIAEWQETTNVGAQVDTLAEEYGSPVAASDDDAASNDNAAEPKFKVGDWVHSIEDGPTNNKVGTVVAYDGSLVPYLVRFDGFDEGHGANDDEWWLQAKEIVASSAPVAQPTAIVALIENGQPKPADIPHVHTNQAAAEREAKRLAGVHKGKQFGVFVLAGTERVEPVYEHEWQRYAAERSYHYAANSLMRISGLPRPAAVAAVEAYAKQAA